MVSHGWWGLIQPERLPSLTASPLTGLGISCNLKTGVLSTCYHFWWFICNVSDVVGCYGHFLLRVSNISSSGQLNMLIKIYQNLCSCCTGTCSFDECETEWLWKQGPELRKPAEDVWIRCLVGCSLQWTNCYNSILPCHQRSHESQKFGKLPMLFFSLVVTNPATTHSATRLKSSASQRTTPLQ